MFPRLIDRRISVPISNFCLEGTELHVLFEEREINRFSIPIAR